MPFKEQDWRVEYGEPSITSRKVEGDNFAAYLRLPNYKNDHADRVMLVTLQTVDPDVGSFHSEGWAGISFYQDEREVLFVGDPFGPRQTWAMDVQQRVPVHIPTPPVIGARKVTLRYEMQDGSVSLHYGEPPLKLPFCRGNIPPGTWINEIRIGASTGSAIAIRDLSILVSD
jgi:hypothetical protein